ncbi:hypothetical protein ATANTOWER_031802 [Ataeniobius toweri]|uniref:Uncharacterized protein n=1 Tax=Ataeniobius toweri TaxID=208326 RepID=A0ABU7ALI5_9TELE|nr:hypothetical protein [Ataeniobius toweri]
MFSDPVQSSVTACTTSSGVSSMPPLSGSHPNTHYFPHSFVCGMLFSSVMIILLLPDLNDLFLNHRFPSSLLNGMLITSSNLTAYFTKISASSFPLMATWAGIQIH